MQQMHLLTLALMLAGERVSAAAAAAAGGCPGELLYNSICLPKEFPTHKPISKVYKDPGYVANPPPHAPKEGLPLPINIDTGRQLFVDNFLIDGGSSGVRTVYHDADYQDQVNPVLAPTEHWEGRPAAGAPKNAPLDMSLAFASAFSGGLWWDPAAEIYKMWYRCGNAQCYATSHDAIEWTKPLDIHSASSPLAKTNISEPPSPTTTRTAHALSLPHTHTPSRLFVPAAVDCLPFPPVDDHNFDGSTIWLDLRPGVPAGERYKMAVVCELSCSHYTIKYSADGTSWRTVLNATGPTSDRATIFYNPFRKKWVSERGPGVERRGERVGVGVGGATGALFARV